MYYIDSFYILLVFTPTLSLSPTRCRNHCFFPQAMLSLTSCKWHVRLSLSSQLNQKYDCLFLPNQTKQLNIGFLCSLYSSRWSRQSDFFQVSCWSNLNFPPKFVLNLVNVSGFIWSNPRRTPHLYQCRCCVETSSAAKPTSPCNIEYKCRSVLRVMSSLREEKKKE